MTDDDNFECPVHHVIIDWDRSKGKGFCYKCVAWRTEQGKKIPNPFNKIAPSKEEKDIYMLGELE